MTIPAAPERRGLRGARRCCRSRRSAPRAPPRGTSDEEVAALPIEIASAPGGARRPWAWRRCAPAPSATPTGARRRSHTPLRRPWRTSGPVRGIVPIEHNGGIVGTIPTPPHRTRHAPSRRPPQPRDQHVLTRADSARSVRAAVAPQAHAAAQGREPRWARSSIWPPMPVRRSDHPALRDGKPSGPVDDEAYEANELAPSSTRRAGCDGVLLDLHGAMVTQTPRRR